MTTTKGVLAAYVAALAGDGSMEYNSEQAEFFAWLNRIRALAWEEGAESAFYEPEIRGQVDYPDNPYEEQA